MVYEARWVGDKATRVSIIIYVDDRNIYVSSFSLETNVEILSYFYVLIVQWAREENLTIDPVKKELTHFSTRRTDKSRFPAISLPNATETRATVVRPSEVTRWLGGHFDPTLSFIPHARILAAKAARVVNGLTMLGNTRRGLHQTILRHLYIACVRTIMTFGSTLW